MIVENEICRVEIKTDETYTVDSADNRHYDVILNPDHYKHNDVCKTLSICVDLFYSKFCLALIGPFYTYDSDCAVLDGDVLTVLQDNRITEINVTDGSILRHIKFDCFGCNFAIYKVPKGYLIYGEIEILMLDFDFNKSWSFSGKDIFVSISGKEPFKLLDTSICLYDFEDNYYKLDLDGNLIEHIPSCIKEHSNISTPPKE